jgi:hydroxymethylbilane synthase
VVFATRRSQLALAQSRAFAADLQRVHPQLDIQELHVVTTGDRIQDRPLTDIGGKGLFVKEIEQALLDGEADFAVHSIKDVPGELAPGLRIACVPVREDPRDAFVSRSGQSLQDVPAGTRVGTSSLRRKTMMLRARPDLAFVPLRGNVDTRLRKVREGVVDATLLACAGLSRLGLIDQATQVLEPHVSLPAVGQGALGIECRADDVQVALLLAAVHDAPTARAVAAERGVMIAAQGSCSVPIAAFATRDGDCLRLHAMLATPSGDRAELIEELTAWPEDDASAEQFGRSIGARLRKAIHG